MKPANVLLASLSVALLGIGSAQAATVDIDLVVQTQGSISGGGYGLSHKITANISGSAQTEIVMTSGTASHGYQTTAKIGWHYGAASTSLGVLGAQNNGIAWYPTPPMFGGEGYLLGYLGEGTPWSYTWPKRYVGYYRGELKLFIVDVNNSSNQTILAEDACNVFCY